MFVLSCSIADLLHLNIKMVWNDYKGLNVTTILHAVSKIVQHNHFVSDQ